MSLNKKGTRQIEIDGETYRWKVRRKPTYEQALAHTPLLFAVEKAGSGGSTLIVSTDMARPDNWVSAPHTPVTPALVARSIHEAKQQGWCPHQPGPNFQIQLHLSEKGEPL